MRTLVIIALAALLTGCAAKKPVQAHKTFDGCSAVSVDAHTGEQVFICEKGSATYQVKVLRTK